MAVFREGERLFLRGETAKARGAFSRYLSFYKQSPTLDDPSETELRASLASISPRTRLETATPSLLLNIIQSQLLICDLDAACEIAAHLERFVAKQRRIASSRGPLAVLMEDYLWSYGDTAFRPDVIHRLRSLGWIDWYPLLIDATNPQRVRNFPLVKCWEDHFPVVWDAALLRFILSCAKTIMRNHGEYYAVRKNKVVPNIYALVEAASVNSTPSISPTNEDRSRAKLKGLGVGEGGWFACFHAREGGYYGDQMNDEKSGKNANIETYAGAMKAVVAAGGTAIRLGDPSMKPLPEMNGIIDMALSSGKEPELDNYLCGRARFVVCGYSGPAGVAAAFGTPLVLTNAFPVDAGGINPFDVFVPKIIERGNGLMPSFVQTCAPPFHEMRWTALLAERGYRLRDNTPDEIEAATKEMLALTSGGNPFWPEDRERQKSYHAMTKRTTRPKGIGGTISAYFIRKHSSLLDNAKEKSAA